MIFWRVVGEMNEARRKEKGLQKNGKMMRKKRMRWTERNVEK